MRHRRPIRLGITGSLASGKSTTLKALRRAGWAVISADEIVAQIYESRGLTKVAVLERFGTTPAGLKKLEKWIHPLVKKEIRRFLRASAKRPVAVEVPLLFEAKFDVLFDRTLFIFAPLKARQRRALKRGMSLKLFQILDSKQMPPSEKAARADFVLHNHSKPRLKIQVALLSKLLLRI